MKIVYIQKTIFFITVLFLISGVVLSCSAPPCPQLNNKAPDFILEDLKGTKRSLQDYQGKTVLLTFWATWCTYCRHQLLFIQIIYDKYHNSGLAVLAVNVNESLEKASAYIKEQEFTFTVLLDKDAKVSKNYCVPGLPATLIIDTNGIIKTGKVGAFENAEEIDKALALSR